MDNNTNEKKPRRPRISQTIPALPDDTVNTPRPRYDNNETGENGEQRRPYTPRPQNGYNNRQGGYNNRNNRQGGYNNRQGGYQQGGYNNIYNQKYKPMTTEGE